MIYFTASDKDLLTEVYFWTLFEKTKQWFIEGSANTFNTKNLINLLTAIYNSYTFLENHYTTM